jgi:hypothetical protein
MSKACIIYCIEAGQLEKNTILSIASIRQFGGVLNSFDIYCVQPRGQFPISQKTRSLLSEWGVTLIQKPLNTRHRYYALANKPIVCDFMMRNFTYDRYIFLDSDTLILNEPVQLLFSASDIAICPVAHKGVGATNLEDENGAYWLKILEHAHVNPRQLRFVETAIEKEKIIAYWNTGVISFHGKSDICEKWNLLVQRALEQELYPDNNIFFVEQTCLAAILMSGEYNITQMSLDTNFPLTKKSADHIDTLNLDEISILHHYHNLDMIIGHLIRTTGQEKEDWILEQLDTMKLYPDNLSDRIVGSLQQWQMKLKEKLYYFIYRINAN